ncbi:uncharacterized protein [Blastocystis hominis]|uniref:MYND-type domain-containing protein n=1 Tax=Blastocystis hominis TaxID=12968 RepID=D8M496_BLAHO|nr:uncharacterized protein [Blastocystis hominis]CBK22885.2 unnamed protein product [Blastocystis hominis]|eukprot:XP_012896933.1 uncharacterized protein [Blastocystis hominis]
MSAVRSCSNPLCGNTESRPGEFKKCSRCKSACYCSKKCQSAHWKNGHREECKPFVDESQKSAKSAERKSEASTEQTLMLQKECQTMYNNFEMASTDLSKLNLQLDTYKISMKKLTEIDESKDVFCRYGSMYMLHDHATAKQNLQEKMDRLNSKIESVSKQVKYFEKKYKDLEANLKEM